jgi:energy-coupling factor transporter ATP-binding protein EcfA2
MAQKPSTTANAQPDAQRTKFIVIHGDKGGVGKSTLAMAMANHLMASGQKVAIVEADTRNPDVARMYEGNVPVAKTNIRNENGWMDVMDFVMKHPGHAVILNTPAGIGESMKSDMESFGNFLQSQGTPVEMELWWVMSNNHDSVNLFNEAYRAYGQNFARVRVVCNLHFGGGDKSEHGPFVLWHESPLKTQIEKKQGLTLFLPGLHIRVVSKVLDPKKVMPFQDAVDAVVGESLALEHSERWKLQQWIADCRTDVFAPAFGQAEAVAVAA